MVGGRYDHTLPGVRPARAANGGRPHSSAVDWSPPAGAAATPLGLVDSPMSPHLGHPDLPDNTEAAARRWAAALGGPAYAVDDETAFVVDGAVEVVSGGVWHRLA